MLRIEGDAVDGMRTLLRGSLKKSLHAMGEEDRLAAAWTVVCGRALCERGAVVGYVDGVVEVQVVDKVWLQQMRVLRQQLMRELATVADVRVTDVQFRIGIVALEKESAR